MVPFTDLLQYAGLIAGSGLAGYIGAMFQFKMKLENIESNFNGWKDQTLPNIQKSLNEEFPKLVKGLGEVCAQFEGAQKAWQIEFHSFRVAIEKDLKHREALNEAEAKGRLSRPDPLENLYYRLDQMDKELKRLRSKDLRNVREERFIVFVKEQEASWREYKELLGEIRGYLETLK